MTHQEAKQILDESEAQIIIDDAAGTATINGELSIDELHAVLQLLEYSA